jgi:hypothetical protein
MSNEEYSLNNHVIGLKPVDVPMNCNGCAGKVACDGPQLYKTHNQYSIFAGALNEGARVNIQTDHARSVLRYGAATVVNAFETAFGVAYNCPGSLTDTEGTPITPYTNGATTVNTIFTDEQSYQEGVDHVNALGLISSRVRLVREGEAGMTDFTPSQILVKHTWSSDQSQSLLSVGAVRRDVYPNL